MSVTPISDMVEQMMAEEVSPSLILQAIRAIETVTSQNVTALRHASRSPGAVRTARYREKLKISKAIAKANDVAIGAENPPKRASHVTSQDRHNCDYLPLLTRNKEESIDEVSKGSKKEKKEEEQEFKSEYARARGQRMAAGAILTDDFSKAALDLGANPVRVAAMWAEFVDYWCSVPGQRGVKLDWLATWRNDVRRKIERGMNGQGKPHRQSASDRASELAELARSAERARGIG